MGSLQDRVVQKFGINGSARYEGCQQGFASLSQSLELPKAAELVRVGAGVAAGPLAERLDSGPEAAPEVANDAEFTLPQYARHHLPHARLSQEEVTAFAWYPRARNCAPFLEFAECHRNGARAHLEAITEVSRGQRIA